MSVINTTVVREITPGVQHVGNAYFRVETWSRDEVIVATGNCCTMDGAYAQYMNAHSLREAAKFFNELADVLDENF